MLSYKKSTEDVIMNSNIKPLLLTGIIVIILFTTLIISNIQSKIPSNDISVTGNTAGNLNNGGLFMELFLLILAVVELLIIVCFVFKLVNNNRAYREIVEKSSQIVHGKLNVEDIKVKEGKSTSGIIAGSVNSIKSNLMTFVEATKGNVIILFFYF